MKKRYYELTFKVTKTCNNGNEMTHNTTVLLSPFDADGKFRPLKNMINDATTVLEVGGYYNVKYVDFKQRVFTFA